MQRFLAFTVVIGLLAFSVPVKHIATTHVQAVQPASAAVVAQFTLPSTDSPADALQTVAGVNVYQGTVNPQ